MQKANSLERLKGKIEGGRRRGRQRMRWLAGITDSTDMSEQALGVDGVLQSLGLKRVSKMLRYLETCGGRGGLTTHPPTQESSLALVQCDSEFLFQDWKPMIPL